MFCRVGDRSENEPPLAQPRNEFRRRVGTTPLMPWLPPYHVDVYPSWRPCDAFTMDYYVVAVFLYFNYVLNFFVYIQIKLIYIIMEIPNNNDIALQNNDIGKIGYSFGTLVFLFF